MLFKQIIKSNKRKLKHTWKYGKYPKCHSHNPLYNQFVSSLIPVEFHEPYWKKYLIRMKHPIIIIQVDCAPLAPLFLSPLCFSFRFGAALVLDPEFGDPVCWLRVKENDAVLVVEAPEKLKIEQEITNLDVIMHMVRTRVFRY